LTFSCFVLVFQTGKEKYLELKVRHERVFEKLKKELLDANEPACSIRSSPLAYHLVSKEMDEFVREW
jgi:hypothetical protein